MNADVTIRDVMNREFIGVSESDSVASIVRLMIEDDADCVVALRGDDPVGVMTARDALRSALGKEGIEGATIADCMQETVPSIRSDRDVAVAIDRLVAADAPGLVVIDEGGEPVGLLTYRNVATTLAHSLRSRGEPYDDEGDFPTEASALGANRDEEVQGICESCGALSRSLSVVEGQSLCPGCRDV